jgi:hypothetical protein
VASARCPLASGSRLAPVRMTRSSMLALGHTRAHAHTNTQTHKLLREPIHSCPLPNPQILDSKDDKFVYEVLGGTFGERPADWLRFALQGMSHGLVHPGQTSVAEMIAGWYAFFSHQPRDGVDIYPGARLRLAGGAGDDLSRGRGLGGGGGRGRASTRGGTGQRQADRPARSAWCPEGHGGRAA